MLHRRACAVSDAIPALMWDTLQWPQVGLFGYGQRVPSLLSRSYPIARTAITAARSTFRGCDGAPLSIDHGTNPTLTLWVRLGISRNPNRLLGLLEARLESAQRRSTGRITPGSVGGLARA